MQRANLDLPVCNFIYGTKLNGEEFPALLKWERQLESELQLRGVLRIILG